MTSRPAIGLAFKRLAEARALNAFLLRESDMGRTNVPLDKRVIMEEGGQGTVMNAPQAARSAFRSRRPQGLTDDHIRAILVKRARQNAKGFRGNR